MGRTLGPLLTIAYFVLLALIARRLAGNVAGAAVVPVEVDYASEFRYREPIVDENTVVLAISQSGETADTLAALREARSRGAAIIAIIAYTSYHPISHPIVVE